MTYTPEQMGFIFRNQERLEDIDMARILGSSGREVRAAIRAMRHGDETTWPISEQERRAEFHLEHTCDSVTLAYKYALNDCLDEEKPTLRKFRK